MKDQPKEKPVSEQDSAQAFIKEYQELCEKHGHMLVASIAKKKLQDVDGFVDVIQMSVGKLPKE